MVPCYDNHRPEARGLHAAKIEWSSIEVAIACDFKCICLCICMRIVIACKLHEYFFKVDNTYIFVCKAAFKMFEKKFIFRHY